MSDDPNIPNLVEKFWGLGLAVFTAFAAFIVGREKHRASIHELSVEVEKQGQRIAALERQGNVEAVQLAEIATSQTHILAALTEIKASLKEKADK